MQIRILSNTSASGKSLRAGEVLSVPKDISEQDAKILIGIKKAIEVKVVETKEEVKKVEAKADVPVRPTKKRFAKTN